MTFREAYSRSINSISSLYGEDEAKTISRRLLEDVFHITPNMLLSHPEREFNESVRLDECISRLLRHEPLQHITGFEMFKGLRITVNPDVLIPRPETAELVDWITASVTAGKDLKIADICTGSGCIALALRKAFPEAFITATDVSEKALEKARENEAMNFDTKSVQFARHDILREDWTFGIPGLIVCNPPYILHSEAGLMHANVLEYEPSQALFVDGADPLLFYKRIIALFLPAHPVHVFFELNPLTAPDLEEFCRQQELRSEFRKDLYGKLRFAHIYR